jgi:hypothetical protein
LARASYHAPPGPGGAADQAIEKPPHSLNC